MSADDVHLAWFDRLLKGTGRRPRPPSAPTSCTTAGATSPAGRRPRRARRELYLRSGGRANSRHGDGGALGRGARATSRPTSTPTTPTCPHGARAATRAATRRRRPMGPEPPGRGRVDEGRARLHERAAGRRPHAGGERRGRPARRVDRGRHRLRRPPVRGRPGRVSRNLQEGLVRARYRNGFEAPEPLVPGEPVEYRLRARAGRHPDPAGLPPARRHRELRLPACGTGTSTRAARSARRAPRPAGWRCRRCSTTASRPSRVVLPVLEGELWRAPARAVGLPVVGLRARAFAGNGGRAAAGRSSFTSGASSIVCSAVSATSSSTWAFSTAPRGSPPTRTARGGPPGRRARAPRRGRRRPRR